MYVINADNVNDTLAQGIRLIQEQGVPVESRGGMTLEVPFPVATVYRNPTQRVLISPARDANPFFHLMESLWIIAGRSDVAFLTEFNKRMADFSDDGVEFNAPYGFRLRDHFQGAASRDLDQIHEVISILQHDPLSRQAVCQIWDTGDLNRNTKDKACNMSIVFRMRDNALDMTVYNRSNDMIWGAYGANAVQFSMLQEYVAASIGANIGTYTQVSNSFHVYTEGPGGDVFRRVLEGFDPDVNPYESVNSVVRMYRQDMPAFNHDLKQFFNIYDKYGLDEIGATTYWESSYFNLLVLPMLCTFLIHKQFGPSVAATSLGYIQSDDWQIAAADWLKIRADKRIAAAEVTNEA